MKASLFHNPSSGEETLSRRELEDRLAASGLEFRYCSTKDPGFKKALKRPEALVIVAGGDGTVAEVMLGLPDPSIPLAIWPAGTANNIARSLGISEKMFRSKKWWKKAARRDFRIATATGPWGERRFVEGIGTGALADAIDEAPHDSWSTEEKIAFGRRVTIDGLERAKPTEHRFGVDGLRFREPLIAIEVLNIAWTSSSLHLAPDADPGSRKLSVVTVAPQQREALIDYVRTGGKTAFDPVVLEGERIVLHRIAGPIRIDDELISEAGSETPVTIEKEATPLRILVPGDD